MSENNLAAGDDVVDPSAEVVDPPIAVTDLPADPPPAADPPAEPHGNSGKSPWYMKRISEEGERARREADRAAAAERRAEAAEALAARLSAAGGTDPAIPPAQARTAPVGEDRQAEIRAEAQKQRFFEDTVDVRNHGMTEFGPAFGETLNILGALGATSDEFIADVLAVDKAGAHKMLKKIAEDPERAVALTGMNSRQRIAELTRMTMAEAKTAITETTPAATTAAPKTVSKAPPPAPPVTATSTKTVDWRSDAASDKEFDDGFWANQETRSKKRLGVRN